MQEVFVEEIYDTLYKLFLKLVNAYNVKFVILTIFQRTI